MKPEPTALSGIMRRPLSAASFTTAPIAPRHGQDPQARTRVVAGLEHFRGSLALGERQRILDDHRAPQRHREQHAEQPAETGNGQHPRITEVVPVTEDDQRRDGEDDAGGDRGTGRGAGLHDVVLEDGAATEQAQHAHGHDCGRDRGRDRQAREQAEIGIGRGQDHREDDRQQHRTEGQLRHCRSLVHVASPEPTEADTLKARSRQVQPPCGPWLYSRDLARKA